MELFSLCQKHEISICNYYALYCTSPASAVKCFENVYNKNIPSLLLVLSEKNSIMFSLQPFCISKLCHGNLPFGIKKHVLGMTRFLLPTINLSCPWQLKSRVTPLLIQFLKQENSLWDYYSSLSNRS